MNVDLLQRRLDEIADSYALHLVVLFGSQADSSATEKSDVDIAVLVDPARTIDSQYDLSLQAELFKAIGTDRLDLVYLNTANPLLRYKAIMNGLVLYERNDSYARFGSYTIRYYADTKKFRELEREFIDNLTLMVLDPEVIRSRLASLVECDLNAHIIVKNQ